MNERLKRLINPMPTHSGIRTSRDGDGLQNCRNARFIHIHPRSRLTPAPFLSPLLENRLLNLESLGTMLLKSQRSTMLSSNGPAKSAVFARRGRSALIARASGQGKNQMKLANQAIIKVSFAFRPWIHENSKT